MADSEKLSDFELKLILNRLRIPSSKRKGPDEGNLGWVFMSFHNPAYWDTPNIQELPLFSYAKVLKLVESQLKTELRKKQLQVDVAQEEEEGWFTVMIKAV